MRVVSISKVTIAMITYNSPLLPYSHPDFLSPMILRAGYQDLVKRLGLERQGE